MAEIYGSAVGCLIAADSKLQFLLGMLADGRGKFHKASYAVCIQSFERILTQYSVFHIIFDNSGGFCFP